MKIYNFLFLGISCLLLSGCDFKNPFTESKNEENYPKSICDNLPEKCKFVYDVAVPTTVTKIGHDYLLSSVGSINFYKIQKDGSYEAYNCKDIENVSWERNENKDKSSEDELARDTFGFVLAKFDADSGYSQATDSGLTSNFTIKINDQDISYEASKMEKESDYWYVHNDFDYVLEAKIQKQGNQYPSYYYLKSFNDTGVTSFPVETPKK